jgi:hypothetical protein
MQRPVSHALCEFYCQFEPLRIGLTYSGCHLFDKGLARELCNSGRGHGMAHVRAIVRLLRFLNLTVRGFKGVAKLNTTPVFLSAQTEKEAYIASLMHESCDKPWAKGNTLNTDRGSVRFLCTYPPPLHPDPTSYAWWYIAWNALRNK